MAKKSNKATEVISKAEAKRMNSRLQETPIAIIGMASVFANAKNLDEYWDNIVERIDAIIDVPPSRWNIEDYYSEDKKAADKTYCKRGGFIPDLDFDPMEFGLPPNILELTDIAQLLALVVARDVMEDAGIADGSGYDRDKVGITLGVGGGLQQIVPLTSRLQGPVLEKVLSSCGVEAEDRAKIIEKFKKAYIGWEENSFPGMLGNVIAGRIANRFDLGGTNCVVDAACAGSLAAMKLAISDLLEYRSEVMISGGICCDNSPFMYMSFSKTPAFTTDDCVRSFDEDSKGMMVGEGIGMIAFKRLEDAERDGDKVYAVLRGIGTSSDGRFKSIYAPRPDGQAKALKRAYEDAGFDPRTCGLIEAHGTGTMAGDAAEFGGLNKFFGTENDERQHIALGSVKSQIGHTKSAAGAAGLIKVCLALHHKVLPPTINVDKPNTQLDIENSPFYINTETRPWMAREDGIPRRAGVSSFGFGGTNFHFVLEEYQPKQEGAYRLNIVPQAIVLAADNEHGVIAHLQAWRSKLAIDADDQPYVFNRLVVECGLKTPSVKQARLGFVALDANDAIAVIDQALKQFESKAGVDEWSTPTGLYYRSNGINAAGKVVALFSGQGSQYVNMGAELACNFPPVLDAAIAMDTEFTANGLPQLSSITYPIPVFTAEDRDAQDKKLQLTQHAQPAIGTFSMGLYKAFEKAGFKADFTAGHSFGELTALWAAGVLNDADYRMLARARGQAMAAKDDPNFDAGTMIAVVGDPKKVAEDIKGIKGVSIANYNSNNQVVVAGETLQVNKAFDELKAKSYKVVKLPVSAAFHTPLVGHAQKPFAKAIDKATFAKPKVPVFANGTGKAHSSKPDDIKQVMKNHILESVRFNEEIDNLYAAGGRVFVEFGPKNVLTKLVENVLGDKKDVVAIALNANPKKSSDTQLRQAAVQMAVYGIELENVDSYSMVARPLEGRKKSPMAMKLNASSYVSAKTQKEFTDALNDGYKIKQSVAQVVSAPAPAVEPKIIERVVERVVTVSGEDSSQSMVESLERSVTQMYEHQKQLLNVHEKFMEGPAEYAKTFQQVLSAQGNVEKLPESLDRTLSMYHELQTETLRVHENYLNAQSHNLSELIQPSTTSRMPTPTVKVAPAVAPVAASAPFVSQTAKVEVAPAAKAVVPTPAPVAQAVVAPVSAAPVASINVEKINQVMMKVVADKTGYPAEMLELSMDMEADLGIDSIKRVEILGAVQDAIPDLPELNPEDLAELRTLGQIVDYMQSKVPAASAASVSVASSVAASAGVDLSLIQSVMMKVVADKTGYPAEMLELGMDMEADLGIDSIKRVEILGAVQDEIPNLPELNPEDLAELRTLGQIVTYMQSKVPAGSAAPVSSVAAPVASSGASVDLSAIQSVMMKVVADKTGYPADMLELGMDMEADLGIDSIKRVEILGAVQDEIPNLPELNPEDLAELRTLGQIVTYMQSKVPAGSAAPVASVAAPVASSGASVDLSAIQSVMMKVVADKTGYPADMLELGMDMEADLGIDSIKRVEILGAVQDEIPNLPELNPEDLAELRTLGQIVTYMQSKSGASAAKVQAAALAPAAAAVSSATSAVDAGTFAKSLMQVVAEKTGYPIEMLELEMDMEADLGIDSIKRVEILGAVQDAVPGLPEMDPETLAEMRTLGEIVGAFTKNTAAPVVSSVSAFEPAPSSTVAIKRLSSINMIEQKVDGAHCLLVDDGSGAAVKLADNLLKNGWKVTAIVPAWVTATSKKGFAKAVNTVALDEVTDEKVNAIINACGQLDTVIYMHASAAISGIEYPDKSKQGLMLAFLLAKLCKVKNASKARASFVVVTRQGGQLGFDQELNADLVQGGLNGLVKTLGQEWANVFCRAIDVSAKLGADKLAAIVADELLDADMGLHEVGYDTIGRMTLVPEITDSYALTSGNSIDANSVFLVSGGAKGVTAHCVTRIAKEYKSKFILLGRSEYAANEPSWAKGITDEAALKKAAMNELIAAGDKPTPVKVQQFIKPILSNREISSAMLAIESAGGKAEYISADVTNAKKLKAAIKPIADKLGAITGIIHGAGVLADKFIEQKTLADFEAVYRTKIDGLAAMLACVKADALKHLVVFSSAAGFYGNPAQSDYSIANEILNKTALRFKALHKKVQTLSFNWGPWDGGMVTPELKRMFTERGVYIIPLAAGAELMMKELAATDNRCAQILVGNDMSGEGESAVKKPEVSRLIKRLQAANNTFLTDHVIGGNQVFPTVCAIAWMVDAALVQYKGFHYRGLDSYKLFKGIVFDGTEAATFNIDMKLIEDSGSDIKVESKISSLNDKGKPVFHYSATLHLARAMPKLSTMPIDLTEVNAKSANIYYKNGTLFHGDSLQGFSRLLRCDNNGLVLECQLPPSVLQKQGEFPLAESNIFANDLIYQALLIQAREQLGCGSLPSATAAWNVYREVKANEKFYLQLQVKHADKTKLVADIQLVDVNQYLIADVKSAEVTVSETLNNLFNPAAA